MHKKALGISFIDASIDEVLEQAITDGGLVVAPAGPTLAVDLCQNAFYRQSLMEADIVVADSGAMVLLWKMFMKSDPPTRISGLKLLQGLLAHKEMNRAGATFWVHPTPDHQSKNSDWLRSQGIEVGPEDSYVAPIYPKDEIEDHKLLALLKERRPEAVVLCIGGGTQERLGLWIRDQFHAAGERCPAIFCIGAAIGFLTGTQVRIPSWADRPYLGWFFRCLSDPARFVPRYCSALHLAYLIARYGEQLPPLKPREEAPKQPRMDNRVTAK